jgi:hypothetical protein
MTGQFDAFEVDELCAAEVEDKAYPISAEELRHLAFAATSEVFPEDLGMLSRCSTWRRRRTGVVGISVQAEGIV